MSIVYYIWVSLVHWRGGATRIYMYLFVEEFFLHFYFSWDIKLIFVTWQQHVYLRLLNVEELCCSLLAYNINILTMTKTFSYKFWISKNKTKWTFKSEFALTPDSTEFFCRIRELFTWWLRFLIFFSSYILQLFLL